MWDFSGPVRSRASATVRLVGSTSRRNGRRDASSSASRVVARFAISRRAVAWAAPEGSAAKQGDLHLDRALGPERAPRRDVIRQLARVQVGQRVVGSLGELEHQLAVDEGRDPARQQLPVTADHHVDSDARALAQQELHLLDHRAGLDVAEAGEESLPQIDQQQDVRQALGCRCRRPLFCQVGEAALRHHGLPHADLADQAGEQPLDAFGLVALRHDAGVRKVGERQQRAVAAVDRVQVQIVARDARAASTASDRRSGWRGRSAAPRSRTGGRSCPGRQGRVLALRPAGLRPRGEGRRVWRRRATSAPVDSVERGHSGSAASQGWAARDAERGGRRLIAATSARRSVAGSLLVVLGTTRPSARARRASARDRSRTSARRPHPRSPRAAAPDPSAWNGTSELAPNRTYARPGVDLADAGGVRRVDDVRALRRVGHPQGDPQVGVGADLGRDHAAGPLRRQDQMDAERPAALGDADQAADEVGQFAGQVTANSSMTIARRGIAAQVRAPGAQVEVVVQVFRARARQQVLATAQFGAERFQGAFDQVAVEVGDHPDRVRAGRRSP